VLRERDLKELREISRKLRGRGEREFGAKLREFSNILKITLLIFEKAICNN